MAWVHAAEIDQVREGAPKVTDLSGKSVGLFYEGGRYYAVLNYCPHAGAPVCRGRVVGKVTAAAPGELSHDPDTRVLRCPWHKWEFDLGTGRALAPIRQRLKTFPVRVDGDAIYVDL